MQKILSTVLGLSMIVIIGSVFVSSAFAQSPTPPAPPPGTPPSMGANGFPTGGGANSAGNTPAAPAPVPGAPSGAPAGAGNTSGPIVYQPLQNIPGLNVAAPDPNAYLKQMFMLIIGLIIVLAFLMLVIGGFEYIFSASTGGKGDGRDRITGAILGLLIALGSYLILNTISPQFVTFDIFRNAPDLGNPNATTFNGPNNTADPNNVNNQLPGGPQAMPQATFAGADIQGQTNYATQCTAAGGQPNFLPLAAQNGSPGTAGSVVATCQATAPTTPTSPTNGPGGAPPGTPPPPPTAPGNP